MLLVLTGLSLCWNVDGLLAPSSARVSSVRLAASSKYYKSNGEQIKAPLSGYMHFCAEERDKVTKLLKDQHGETFQTKMVMVELGQRWKQLDDSQVAQYTKRGTMDRERYNAEMMAAGYPTKKDTSKKKSNRPKSAYLHFCAAERPAVTESLKKSLGADFKNTMVMKSLGAKWKEIDAATKSKYEMMAKVEKEAYDQLSK